MEQSDHRRPPRFSAVCGSSASMVMALKGSCGGVSVRAPARSLAERARGLRAISCSLGADRPACDRIERRLGRGCGRQMARACRRAAGAGGEELLHDAVFERMERHDDETPAGLQDALGRMQRAHEFAELVVDGDAQPLEHARRRMNAAGLLPDERCDEIGELPRGLEGLAPPHLDDGAGHGAGAPLLAVMIEDVGEFGLGGFVDEIGRARAASAPCACRAGPRCGTRSRARPGRAASTTRRCRARRRRRASKPCALRDRRRDRRSVPAPASGAS